MLLFKLYYLLFYTCKKLIQSLFFHITHTEFFFRIVFNEMKPITLGCLIFAVDTFFIFGCKRLQMEVICYHAIGPCPLILFILIIYGNEPVFYLFYFCDDTCTEIISQLLFFRFGKHQSGRICPSACAYRTVGQFHFMIADSLAHIQTDKHIIILDTVEKGVVLDDTAFIIIGCRIFAMLPLQLFQQPFTLDRFRNGKRTQPVEMNKALTPEAGTHITLLPLVGITICSYRDKIATRNYICRVADADNIRERHHTCIRMILYFAHAHRERADCGGHQNMCATGCFASSLEQTVMYWSHLISMIAVIRIGTGIIKRILTSDK